MRIYNKKHVHIVMLLLDVAKMYMPAHHVHLDFTGGEYSLTIEDIMTVKVTPISDNPIITTEKDYIPDHLTDEICKDINSYLHDYVEERRSGGGIHV